MHLLVPLGAALAGAASLFAQSPSEPALLGGLEQKSQATAARLAAAGDAFGTRLYRELAKEPGNLFFSPYSISVALTMTAAGAQGRTAAQMHEVLHTAGFDPHVAHVVLRQALSPRQLTEGWGEDKKQVPSFRLDVANRIWVQQGLSLQNAFVRTLKERYAAPFGSVDFARPNAVRTEINRWVAERTQQKIQDIVPAGLPDPATRIALANAIYFKAAWEESFTEHWTQEAPFTLRSGEAVQTKTMRSIEDFGYAELPEGRLAALPYRGGDCAMWILLPNEKEGGLAALERALSAESFASHAKALQSKKLDVRLPKFRFTSAFDLRKALQALGMQAPFDATASDFTGITKDVPIVLGPVLHKAFIAVDEEGTEAAAATVVMGELGAAPERTEPLPFVVDRPFVFAIRHVKTGATLFLGRVDDPR